MENDECLATNGSGSHFVIRHLYTDLIFLMKRRIA